MERRGRELQGAERVGWPGWGLTYGSWWREGSGLVRDDRGMGLRFRETVIPAEGVATLVWDGEELLDPTTGTRFGLDGTRRAGNLSLGYPFDRAVALRRPEAFWAIVYENRGTKALLLKDGALWRELNRSYFQAKNFDYPVALAVAPSGRVVVIHCPRHAEQLAVEDAETGELLAEKSTPFVEFHSRLAVSADYRYLLDAGWIWHPVNVVWVCSMEELLAPGTEEVQGFNMQIGAEVDSAAFLGNDRVVVTTTDEVLWEGMAKSTLGAREIGVYSLERRGWVSRAPLARPSGAILAWREWVIGFYVYPQVIDVATGRLVANWPHLGTGTQEGSINLVALEPIPIALDGQQGRFAVRSRIGGQLLIITLTWRAGCDGDLQDAAV